MESTDEKVGHAQTPTKREMGRREFVRSVFGRWFQLQYGLRSLLIATFILCMVLGMWTNSAHRQRVAVSSIKEAGGYVEYRMSPPEPATSSSDDPFGDPAPAPFATRVRERLSKWAHAALGDDFFHSVEAVEFDGGDDLAPALSRLSDLSSLEQLELPYALDEDLPAVAKLSHLRRLELWNGAITDDGLRHLMPLRQLTHLKLSDQSISDRGLSYLAGMENLESLDLTRTEVTGKGLRWLQGLRHLHELNLWGTRLDDSDVPDIAALPALERIHLSGTLLTKRGLDALHSLHPGLQFDLFDPDERPNPAGLVRGGEWARALELLEKESDIYESFWVAWMRARCHAAFGMLTLAEKEYVDALASVPMEEGAVVHLTEHTSYQAYWRTDIWIDLCSQPELFDRVAKHRPDDPLRWEAEAWRHILAGRWPEAADAYARAASCSHDDYIVFEYAVARLAEGNLRAAQRNVQQRFDALEDGDQLTIEPKNDDDWRLAAQLWLFSPQNMFRLPGLTAWIGEDVIKEWRSSGLAPLAHYRLENCKGTVQFTSPPARREWNNCGRLWLVKAMAYQRLGDPGRAREAYARGLRWIARRRKVAQSKQDYTSTSTLLEAEVLRREAEAILFDRASLGNVDNRGDVPR